MCEASMHEGNSFVTLTYKDDPVGLDYKDFRLFMRRARRKLGPFRFYMCGEYGEQQDEWLKHLGFKLGRPHFHALLFGVHFDDRYEWRKSPSGSRLYRSGTLEELWPHGSAEIGAVTHESAAYVSGYIMKKVTGELASAHYVKVDTSTGSTVAVLPEFTRMSLKPGIGSRWLNKYLQEVYAHDGGSVILNGRKCAPPRYFDKVFKDVSPLDFEELWHDRFQRSLACRAESTDERLRDREVVAAARLRFKSRSLE